ncbi:sigma 54-interacting transcriptional regulator [Dehalobacter sp. DCM]|uniref:sigma-54-dependent Fis family transcriptional regulator n=1 Tax=Dehalobacter sp. DCM TaxID=2907827 RepID=UPI00308167A9|nr:sigma 54-interacting transcriptional regulator [Dehalobacter sp. DCM]
MKPIEQLLSPLIRNFNNASSQLLSDSEVLLMEKMKKQKLNLLSNQIDLSQVNTVSSDIAESWMRSHRNGVTLHEYPSLPVLSRDAFLNRLTEKEQFLRVSDPFIEKLEHMFSDTSGIVFLTDENGTILRVVIGNNPRIEELNTFFQLTPGTIWREETVGTCSHSMSILLKSPIQISGPEHYCEAFQQTSCSSAPVFDANNNLEGTISIACPFLHGQNSHTLGLAIAMAWAIQKDLQLSAKEELLNTTITTTPDAILAVDQFGNIINSNIAAEKLLFNEEHSLIGLPLTEVLGHQTRIESALRSGKPMYGMDITVEKTNQKLHISSAQPVKNKYGKNLGCIFTLKGIDRSRKNVKKAEFLQPKYTFDKILGDSSQIQHAINLAKKFAPLDGNILIQGESGTGKEVFAQCIHMESRSDAPFIAENCAAIPRTLIESELFGYEGGAFTGAERHGRPGKIELADGGTLFLDEIGDMPLEVQTVLLRVIEEKVVKRVGGSRYIPVDFRLVTATNKDLLELVQKNQFRQDLYYRLAVFKISIPPLRERGPDIIKLVDTFIERVAQKQKIPAPTLSKTAKYLLLQYNWPGNVRQLENAVTYAVNVAKDGIVCPEDFPEEIYQSVNLPISMESPKKVSPVTDIPILKNKLSLKELEKIAIEQAVHQTNNNVAKAAELLEMSKSTLYRKIREYSISI